MLCYRSIYTHCLFSLYSPNSAHSILASAPAIPLDFKVSGIFLFVEHPSVFIWLLSKHLTLITFFLQGLFLNMVSVHVPVGTSVSPLLPSLLALCFPMRFHPFSPGHKRLSTHLHHPVILFTEQLETSTVFCCFLFRLHNLVLGLCRDPPAPSALFICLPFNCSFCSDKLGLILLWALTLFLEWCSLPMPGVYSTFRLPLDVTATEGPSSTVQTEVK